MAKKPKPAVAFAAVSPQGKINPYWVHAEASTIRGADPTHWATCRKGGWRVVKVKITAIGNPR